MRLVLAILLFPSCALAESIVALRTIPARSVVGASDVTLVDAAIAGAVTDMADVIGMETQVTVYAGQPVLTRMLISPSLVERNQRVSILFNSGSLRITAEGRALDQGSVGEVVRVMNLASRVTVTGTVGADGAVHVLPDQKGN